VADNQPQIDDLVRVAAFRAIYSGEAPSPEVLADRLTKPIVEVRAAVGRLIDRGLLTVDSGGNVTGSHGLSLSPGDYRLTFDLGERYVWCAVDAVGIPAAMAVNAKVESRCYQCGRSVRLTIRDGHPQGPEADSLRIGLGVTGSSTGKVIEDVCPMLNFFCSQEHAEAWAASAGSATIIDLYQAAEMGRRQWADVV